MSDFERQIIALLAEYSARIDFGIKDGRVPTVALVPQFKALFLATIKECVPTKKKVKAVPNSRIEHTTEYWHGQGFDSAISETLAKAEEVVAPPKQERK